VDIFNTPLCQDSGQWFITLFVFWDPVRSGWREEVPNRRLGLAWEVSQQFREEPKTKQDSRHPGMTNTYEGNLAQFIQFSPQNHVGEVFGFDFESTSKQIVLVSFPLWLFPLQVWNVMRSVQLTFPESGFRVPQLSGAASVMYWRPAFYVSLSPAVHE